MGFRTAEFSSTITFRQMKTIEINGSFRNELGKKSSKEIENQAQYLVEFMEKKKIFISQYLN